MPAPAHAFAGHALDSCARASAVRQTVLVSENGKPGRQGGQPNRQETGGRLTRHNQHGTQAGRSQGSTIIPPSAEAACAFQRPCHWQISWKSAQQHVPCPVRQPAIRRDGGASKCGAGRGWGSCGITRRTNTDEIVEYCSTYAKERKRKTARSSQIETNKAQGQQNIELMEWRSLPWRPLQPKQRSVTEKTFVLGGL
jgi:hypothetical protein